MIALLTPQLTAARRRTMLDTLAVGLPVLLGFGAVTWRWFGLTSALGLIALGALALGWTAWRRARRFDHAWLVAALNERAPDLEDSSDLLLQPPGTLQGLAALQQARLQDRLAQAAALDLRPAWSRHGIAVSVGLGVIIGLCAALWPLGRSADISADGTRKASVPGAPRLAGTRLRITPPAYTGQRAYEQSSLDVRAPQNSRIEWTVRLVPAPDAVRLSLPGQAPLGLSRDDGRWRGGRAFEDRKSVV